MLRIGKILVLTGLLLVAAAPVQAQAWRFRWQTGQVLTYRVEHLTTASEVVSGNKLETASKLVHVKSWQVLDVDPQGVATVQLSLKSLKIEIRSPEGEMMTFDSDNPDKGTAQMREQLQRYLTQPLVLMRVDSKGKVVEVKECKHGPASRFESEPPFVLTLADEPVAPGQAWERTYNITLEPPQGTGEKFEAVQRYGCQSVAGGQAVVALTTAIKAMPSAPADQVPLLQLQPEGEIVFDFEAGRLHKASLRIDKELKGHQGEGSSYHFQSTYTEQFVGNN
jgi:hypothetical protein